MTYVSAAVFSLYTFFFHTQFCSAINNLEKFRTELERVAARMLAIMRENAPEKLTEYVSV